MGDTNGRWWRPDDGAVSKCRRISGQARRVVAAFAKERNLSIRSTTPVFIAVAAGFVCASVWAQSSASPSRAEVNAETRAAEKAHQLTPAGEGSPAPAPEARSTKTRGERKAETLEARKTGQLHRTGLEPEYKEARALAKMPSTTTRAERKATTKAAEKSGQLTRPARA